MHDMSMDCSRYGQKQLDSCQLTISIYHNLLPAKLYTVLKRLLKWWFVIGSNNRVVSHVGKRQCECTRPQNEWNRRSDKPASGESHNSNKHVCCLQPRFISPSRFQIETFNSACVWKKSWKFKLNSGVNSLVKYHRTIQFNFNVISNISSLKGSICQLAWLKANWNKMNNNININNINR